MFTARKQEALEICFQLGFRRVNRFIVLDNNRIQESFALLFPYHQIKMNKVYRTLCRRVITVQM